MNHPITRVHVSALTVSKVAELVTPLEDLRHLLDELSESQADMLLADMNVVFRQMGCRQLNTRDGGFKNGEPFEQMLLCIGLQWQGMQLVRISSTNAVLMYCEPDAAPPVYLECTHLRMLAGLFDMLVGTLCDYSSGNLIPFRRVAMLISDLSNTLAEVRRLATHGATYRVENL